VFIGLWVQLTRVFLEFVYECLPFYIVSFILCVCIALIGEWFGVFVFLWGRAFAVINNLISFIGVPLLRSLRGFV